MNLSVKRQQIYGIIGSLFFLLVYNVFFFLIAEMEFEIQMKVIAVLAIFLGGYIACSTYFAYRRIDCYLIFVAMTFVFMFGQHILLLIDWYPQSMALVQNRVSEESAFNASCMVLNALLYMHFGYMITGRNRPVKLDLPDVKKDVNTCERLMYAGKIVFCLVLVPTLVILINNIYLSFTLGYGQRIIGTVEMYNNSPILRISSLLEGFMVPALLAMFIANKKEKKWPVILIIIYIGMYLLSGSRIKAFILLLGIFYVYIRVYAQISKRLFFKIVAIFLLIIVTFSVLSDLRHTISQTGDINKGISETIDNQKENNPIIGAVAEAGFTFIPTAVVVENCPSQIDYLFGESYMSAIAYVLPNGFTNNYFGQVPGVDETFRGYILINSAGGIGSSFIAEAFYNFGYFSYVLMMLYGILLGILSYSVEKNIYKSNFMKIFMYIGVFVIIIFYVRSDTRTFFRNYIWYYMPVYILAKVVPMRTRKHNKTSVKE